MRLPALTLLSATLACLTPAVGGAAELLRPGGELKPLFSEETPIGTVEYLPGRGLRLGRSGLTIGGFTTLEFQNIEGGRASAEIDAINFFFFLDPHPRLSGFVDLEIGGLGRIEDLGDPAWETEFEAVIERMYGDLLISDAVDLRFGKFLVPFGLWNPIPAEPLVWTTSRPLQTEETFEEFATGASLRGRFFPGERTFSYEIYSQFLDTLDGDPEDDNSVRAVGTRFELDSLENWSIGASYYGRDGYGEWLHFGGLDYRWRGRRLDFWAEATVGEAEEGRRPLWGFYAQGATPLLDDLHGVVRFEHFDPGSEEVALDILTLGLAWRPLPLLLLKADYNFITADAADEEEGTPNFFLASVSILF